MLKMLQIGITQGTRHWSRCARSTQELWGNWDMQDCSQLRWRRVCRQQAVLRPQLVCKEAARASESLGKLYQNPRYHNKTESILNGQLCQNIKSKSYISKMTLYEDPSVLTLCGLNFS